MQGGAPSHVDLFDWKPELVKRRGQQLPESIAKTPAPDDHDRRAEEQVAPARHHQVQALGQGRLVDVRLPAAHRRHRRQDLPHQLDAHRRHQPRPRRDVLPHRGRTARPAEPRRVAELRPRQPQREPADLRRHDLARPGGVVRPTVLRTLLGRGLPALALPGRQAPRRRRPGPLPVQPHRHEPARAARPARRPRRDEPASSRRRPATPRSARASRSTRWPSACR